jgi:D-glycero-D-manno-heptose 1,7-bisphosphate phosphatase
MISSKTQQNSLKAIFLDRDGVLNRKLPENNYVRCPSEFDLLPEVLPALRIFRQLGFALVVITNQRGIGRGLMTDDDLHKVHNFMNSLFRDAGLSIDGIYYCPHDKADYCDCRKPAPGMILAATKDLNIDLSSSFMVGDSASDIKAAQNAGVRSVLISQNQESADADLVFRSLLGFAEFLLDRNCS